MTPVAGSQACIVRSWLPEMTVWPSCVNTSPLISAVCPVKVVRGWPVAASHSRTVLSAPPEAIVRPSKLNTRYSTVLV